MVVMRTQMTAPLRKCTRASRATTIPKRGLIGTETERNQRPSRVDWRRLYRGDRVRGTRARMEVFRRLVDAHEAGDTTEVKRLLSPWNINKISKDKMTALMLAAQCGHRDIVKMLVDASANTNAVSENGDSALTLAVDNRHSEVVKLLVKAGATVDFAKPSGSTALLVAAHSGDVDIVKTLLDARAAVDFVDSNGWSALHFAADEGHIDIVEILLNYRASVNAVDSDGVSALMLAAYKGHIEIAQTLVEAGAKIELATHAENWTALMQASGTDHVEIVKNLIAAGAAVDAADSNGWTSLMESARLGHNDVAKVLLDAGASVDYVNSDGWTALMFAADNGHAKVASMLIGAGANVDTTNVEGWISLMKAANNGHIRLVKLLLDAGASIDVANNGGWTALIYAACEGQAEIALLLLDAGADVDLSTAADWTALMYAAAGGYVEIVKSLLNAKASVDSTNQDGRTALALAAQHGHAEAAGLLIAAAARVDLADKIGWSPLMIAAESGYIEVAKKLLDAGASVDLGNEEGWTALTLASQNGELEMVKLLLDAGAVADVATSSGATALMIAAQHGQCEVVHLLCGSDAGIDNVSDVGRTALIYAALKGQADAVKVLIDAGAKVNVSDKYKSTALSLAAELGHLETLKVLLTAKPTLNEIDDDGATATVCAAMNGHADIVRALLEAGEDPTIPDNNDKTALEYATEREHTATVQVLNEAANSPIWYSVVVKRGLINEVRQFMDEYLHSRGPHGCTPVLVAAQYGQLEILKLLVFRGARLSDRDEFGWTALHFATQSGNVAAINFLMAQRADADVVDERGLRPIDVAAMNGHIDVVRALTTRGVSLDHVSLDGRTILHHAASGTSASADQVVSYVLTEDEHLVNNLDACGRTALHIAIDKGNVSSVEVLLHHGANVHLLVGGSSVGSSRTESALHLAAKGQHHDIVRLLLDQPGVEIDVRDSVEQTPLIHAVSLQNCDIARTLISHGANPNSSDQGGVTPLFIASRLNSDELVKLLLEHGARVDVKTALGQSPLTVARSDNIRSVLRVYQSSQQYHDRCLALCNNSDDPLDLKELQELAPLITSVYDLRLLLVLVSRIADDKSDNQRSAEVAPLLNAAFGHILANKLVLDDDACVFFLLVLEHCADAKLLSQREFMRWKVQVTKVNMESAEWVVELKRQVHHNSYRLDHHDQNIRLLVQGVRAVHTMVMENREVIKSVTTRIDTLEGQVSTGKKLLAGLVSHSQMLTDRMNHLKRRLELGEDGMAAVTASVNSLHNRVNAGEKLLTQLVPHVRKLSGRVDHLQYRLETSESNILTIASSFNSFRNMYSRRLEQEQRVKSMKMGFSVLASLVGFAFAPLLNGLFDSVIDLTNPVEIFDHAYSENDVVNFLAQQSTDHLLKPLIQDQLESLAIPVDEFESVLRQELVLRRPELVTECQQRGLNVQLEFGSASEVQALMPKLVEEQALMASMLDELQDLTSSNEFDSAMLSVEQEQLSALTLDDTNVSRVLEEVDVGAMKTEAPNQDEEASAVGSLHRTPLPRMSNDTEALPQFKREKAQNQKKEPRAATQQPVQTQEKETKAATQQSVQSSVQGEQETIEFVDDIGKFPYHYAVQASDGDLEEFLELTDVIGSDEDDPDAKMELQLVQRDSSRVSICAAEYAYLLGYREVGDYLADRMDDSKSCTRYEASASVRLVNEHHQLAYVYAVQESQGDVDECALLLEVVDEETDRIDARMEADIVIESESKSEVWSAVEYACHLGYVAIVKHLLVKKRVKTPVMNVMMLQRARQRAKLLGR